MNATIDKILFHRQRASLELISRQGLLRILTADRRAGFSSPTVNWYYENIRVSPTSRTEHQLIVRVRLPLTDSVSYKTYYIWSGPIPGNSSNYNVQLQVSADVATHTSTGCKIYASPSYFLRGRTQWSGRHFSQMSMYVN